MARLKGDEAEEEEDDDAEEEPVGSSEESGVFAKVNNVGGEFPFFSDEPLFFFCSEE